jgi:hypothetical protein
MNPGSSTCESQPDATTNKNRRPPLKLYEKQDILPKDTILTQRGFDMGGPVYLAWLGTMRLSSWDDVPPSMYSMPWCS